jgi:hypothetical protein
MPCRSHEFCTVSCRTATFPAYWMQALTRWTKLFELFDARVAALQWGAVKLSVFISMSFSVREFEIARR